MTTAIDILDKMINEDKEYHRINKHWKYSQLTLHEAKSRIQALHIESQWIDVKDRLPENYNDTILVYPYMELGYFYKGKWYIQNNGDYHDGGYGNEYEVGYKYGDYKEPINYWMELPEAPLPLSPK